MNHTYYLEVKEKITCTREFKDQEFEYRMYFLFLVGKWILEFLGNYEKLNLSYSTLVQ